MPHSDRLSRGPSRGWVAAANVIAILLFCAPMLAHAPLPLGSDVYSTAHYLQGFMKAIAEGDLYPRWTDGTNQGLGAPSFVMFPPLAYYGAGLACWLTGSLISGLKLYLSAVAILTVLSFYALARQWTGPGLPAALAAGAYLLLPYHVLDLYQRFAISETTAFIFFPLLLLSARRVTLAGGRIDFALLAASYAGLLYTHIVSALHFSLFFGLWLLRETRLSPRAMLRPAAALACGLLMAAPALLPAVVERAHVNISWIREMPNGDYRINFITRDDVLPGLGFKDPVKPPVFRSAHSQLVLAGVSAALALAWTSSSQRRRRGDILTLAAGAALAYLMQLEISAPIWRLVPELSSIQFPWRLQTTQVLAASLLLAFALSAGWGRAGGAEARKRSLVGAPAAILVLTALVNLGLSAQNARLKPFRYDEQLNASPGVVGWSEPAFTPREFEPYRQLKNMRIETPSAQFLEGEGDVRVASWASSSRRLEIRSASGGLVTVRSFWFPGWTGRMDGQPLELTSTPRTGLVAFKVPRGDHEVELRFVDTPVRRSSWWAGLAGLVLAGMLAWASPRVGTIGSAPASSGVL